MFVKKNKAVSSFHSLTFILYCSCATLQKKKQLQTTDNLKMILLIQSAQN